jgi:hypothetical protein
MFLHNYTKVNTQGDTIFQKILLVVLNFGVKVEVRGLDGTALPGTRVLTIVNCFLTIRESKLQKGNTNFTNIKRSLFLREEKNTAPVLLLILRPCIDNTLLNL